MNKRINPIFFILTILFLSSCKNNSVSEKDKFINNLIAQMTLEEKLGQLNLPTSGDITTGEAQSSDIAQKIRDGKVGGLFNIKGVAKIREVQKIAVEESRLKIPLLFGMDVIHGYETTFPIPLGLSCSWDMDLIEKSAQIAAKEATADGICWTFSPMVDIAHDPRWGRIAEGSGEDAYLGSQVAKAMVKGYQGEDLTDSTTIMSCVKHYALYGAPDGGRDYNTVDMSRLKMYNEYFPPYKAAVDAGVSTVMASFNEVDGIPATGNKWLMTEVLRNQWGFKGFVVTDYTGINEMTAHGMGDLQRVSSLALNAGIDMDMVGEGFLTTLKKSLEEGKVSEKQIDEAVKRILSAKWDLGLFKDPYKYCDVNRAKNDVFTADNRDFARKVATESMVLLKNEHSVLPLKKSGTIAIIGPLGNSKVNMSGTWSVATPLDQCVSLIDGMKQVAGEQVKIVYAKGSNLAKDSVFEANATMFGRSLNRQEGKDAQLLSEALRIARQADIIVAALGESSEMSGESSSRTNLNIPDAQQELLQELLKTGKSVVLVLFTGRPLILVKENAQVPAILNVWFSGSEAGLAIADVLFGDVNPSGKLTTTFPRSVGQIPLTYSYKNTGRPLENTEGRFEKFKTNYLDERNEPLYPFGYGLSYTDFTYSNLRLSSDKMKANEKITVSIDVQNTGNYDGKEIVQLYIRDIVGSITRPTKELKGFQKIFLKKGEKKTVVFDVTIDDLKFYNSELKYVAEPGMFEIMVGKNSSEGIRSQFELLNK